MIAPELFTPEAGHYLGLYSVSRRLEAARTTSAARGRRQPAGAGHHRVDGNISDVDKALRAAQEALKQALERGATDEEIKKLTDNVRAALDNFLRQLAEQFRDNPQQLARPLDPNTKMLTQQDLKSMLDRLERMSVPATRMPPSGYWSSSSRCWRTCRWRSPARAATTRWSRR